MFDEAMITPGQHRWARRQPIGLRPGKLYEQIREPYFFGYVRDQLVKAYGAETVRSGGLKVYTTIEPRWQRLAQKAISETLTRKTDPAAAIVSIDPASGAIRAMTAIVPGQDEQPVQPPLAGAPPAGIDLQDVRPRGGGRARAWTPRSTYYVSAPFMYRPTASGNCDDGTWWCVQYVRLELHRLDVGRAGHPPLRQHGVRAAHARRRSRAGRVDGPASRGPHAARGERAVPARHGPWIGGRLTARHGLRVRDARGRRHLQRADRDPQGDRQRQAGRPLGCAPSAVRV